MGLSDRAKSQGIGALKDLIGGTNPIAKNKKEDCSDEQVQKNFWMPKSLAKRMRLFMLDTDVKREAGVMRDALSDYLDQRGF